MAFQIVGPSSLQWDSAWVTANGNSFVVTIPGSATAPLQAGTYHVAAQYSKDGERFTESRHAVEVAADPSAGAAALTGSAANIARLERELEQVNCAIDAFLAGKAVQYYQIGNRQVGTTPLKELVAMRDQIEMRLAVAKRRAKGFRGFGVPVKHRFREAR